MSKCNSSRSSRSRRGSRRWLTFAAAALLQIQSWLVPSVRAQYGGGQAGGFSFGACPELETVRFFKPEYFTGDWFTQYFTFSAENENGTTCQRFRYFYNPDDTFGFHNTQADEVGQFVERCGYAEPVDENNLRGNYYLNFAVHDLGYQDQSYMILDTDYKTFAAVFSCDDLWFNVERYINAWVITRERDHHKAKEAIARGLHAFGRHGLGIQFNAMPQSPYCIDVTEPSCADRYENLGPDRRRGIGTDGFLGPIFDFGNGILDNMRGIFDNGLIGNGVNLGNLNIPNPFG